MKSNNKLLNNCFSSYLSLMRMTPMAELDAMGWGY